MLENIIVAALLLLLTGAAVCDIAHRSIPNLLSALVVLAGLIRIKADVSHSAFLLAPAALLLLLLLLYSRKLLGGGDVKLMAALSLALTAPDCYRFVVATALFGGLLAAGYLLLRRALPPVRCRSGASYVRRVITVEAWRIRRGLSLPYGVAIAAGGIFVLLHPTPW